MSVIHGPKLLPTPLAPGGLPSLGEVAGMAKGAVGTALLRQAEAMLGIRFDPAPAYLFYVSISGYLVALFTNCDGIQASRSVEEVIEGGLNDQVHTLPGPVHAGKITLKRGMSISRELWDWFSEGLYDCKVKRVSMSVIQGAPGMSALAIVGKSGAGIVKCWDIEGAFPVSYSLSSLDVNNTSQVVFESVEIAFKTISLSRIVGTPMSPTALF